MPQPRSERLVRFGKIGRAHGIRGEVRIFTDDPASDTLARVERIRVEPEGGSLREHRIVRARPSQRFWIVTLEGVASRDAAEALTGARCWVERALLPAPADEDELYACDLVGLSVVTRDGQPLGRVVDVFDNGAHDVLVYRSGSGRDAEHMVPFLDAYVPEVDLDAGRVVVEPLQFLEDEAPQTGGDGD